MPRKIYTPEQIIRKLRETEVLIAEGMTAQQAARQIGISEQTYYRTFIGHRPHCGRYIQMIV